MTAWANSLIRISNYEVETLQKRLAEITARRASAEVRMAVLDAEAEVEERLGRRVRLQDLSVGSDREDRERQGVDDDVARGRAHAATRKGASKTCTSRCATSLGSVEVTRRSRSARGTWWPPALARSA